MDFKEYNSQNKRFSLIHQKNSIFSRLGKSAINSDYEVQIASPRLKKNDSNKKSTLKQLLSTRYNTNNKERRSERKRKEKDNSLSINRGSSSRSNYINLNSERKRRIYLSQISNTAQKTKDLLKIENYEEMSNLLKSSSMLNHF